MEPFRQHVSYSSTRISSRIALQDNSFESSKMDKLLAGGREVPSFNANFANDYRMTHNYCSPLTIVPEIYFSAGKDHLNDKNFTVTYSARHPYHFEIFIRKILLAQILHPLAKRTNHLFQAALQIGKSEAKAGGILTTSQMLAAATTSKQSDNRNNLLLQH